MTGQDILSGLTAPQKRLPAYLFYDEAGSLLYEQITELPEYYLTRTERKILATHASDMVLRARQPGGEKLCVVEMGAGSASKTGLILSAVVAQQSDCLYVPIDVSASALADAKQRIAAELVGVEVQPLLGRHEDSFETVGKLGSRRLVLFIGSSIGNFPDDDAANLLAGLRRVLSPGDCLLLGTDLLKDPSILIPAYDDAQGITAAFNKNILVHINRMLDATFEPNTFRHVARWNAAASRIEMHLESLVDQTVEIHGLSLQVHLRRGESIHTESSEKYNRVRVDAILSKAGFVREHTYSDGDGLFAVHLARV